MYTIEIEVGTSFFQGCDIDADLTRQASTLDALENKYILEQLQRDVCK
jgi:hypothetical protein